MQEATVNPTWRIRGVRGRRSRGMCLTLRVIASAAVLGRGLEEEAQLAGAFQLQRPTWSWRSPSVTGRGPLRRGAQRAGVPVTGTGYLELIGYADG